VAVSNVDEVVARSASADAAEAREKLMERRWPAGTSAEYIKLIDDPTHTPTRTAPTTCPKRRPARSSICGFSA
jgi:hypothetical protein